MKVMGVLLLHPDAPAFDGAAAWVMVEDAARADTAATPLAEMRLAGIAHVAGTQGRVPFALDCPAPPPGRAWRVRARIDVAGDRGGALGDFYSTESVAVAPGSGPLLVRVEPSAGAGRW